MAASQVHILKVAGSSPAPASREVDMSAFIFTIIVLQLSESGVVWMSMAELLA